MDCGKWRVSTNRIGDNWMYIVFRLRDVNAVDHSGNREYATGYMDSKQEAQKIADELPAEET